MTAPLFNPYRPLARNQETAGKSTQPAEAAEATERTGSPASAAPIAEPFYVEKDREQHACIRCGRGTRFDVVYGPDDSSWSSYTDEESAEDEAGSLNRAFALGVEKGGRP